MNFSTRLLKWFDQHGRHDLPWQQNVNPYRVWVSEIMLQQTQVKTVIPYFERFMDRFPEVQSLAKAEIDEVLHLWTGLGYYARGRNLHKTAQMICHDHNGQFPKDIDVLISLPGIGRSTAGAILSIATGQRHPILDGNVKRVLCRYHAVEGWPGNKKVEEQLWQQAEQHTPKKRVAEYTQAIMDLGATVCTRTKPDCENCPCCKACLAFQQGKQTDFPHSKPKKEKPTRETVFMIMQNPQGQVLLAKRPPTGIWGGLWSFPEVEDEKAITDSARKHYGFRIQSRHGLESVRHTFSHFHLKITPVLLKGKMEGDSIAEGDQCYWYQAQARKNLGLAAPVKTLLEKISMEAVDDTNGTLRKTG